MKINYLTSPKTPTEIEAVIKSLLKRKREKKKEPDGWFWCRILPYFYRRDNTNNPQTIAQIETERTLPKAFYKATFTLITNHTKTQQRKTTSD